MTRNLRVLEFMVLKAGGIPVFHYAFAGTRRLDELLSGFLSAITSFASEFGERSVQSLSFEGSELLYEQTSDDLMFIFLVETGASEKVLRAVLRELSERFLDRYSVELQMDIPIKEVFEGFNSDIREVFDHYDSILRAATSLGPFVVPRLKKDAWDNAVRNRGLLDDIHRDLGAAGTRVLEAIDGKKPLSLIAEDVGLEDEEVVNVIEYLTIAGVLSIIRLYPIVSENDSRFDAFLDLVGLPRKEYQLLKRASPLCTGESSLTAISERLGVTADRLYEVLTKLGDLVIWKQEEVLPY